MNRKDLRYTKLRMKLLCVVDGNPHAFAQTTDGVPTNLIVNTRSLTAAADKAFRDMLDAGLFTVVDGGRVRVTPHGHDHRDVWSVRHGGFDAVFHYPIYR